MRFDGRLFWFRSPWMSSEETKKSTLLDRLAEENGVAIVVIDDRNREVSASNNNSICRALSGSAEFNPLCGQYCGRAFAIVHETGEQFDYECYAGLSCSAVRTDQPGKQFVTIVGRTFLRSDSYRTATEKAINGEWSIFKPTEFFDNVLISGGREGVDKTIKDLPRAQLETTAAEKPAKSEPLPLVVSSSTDEEPSGKITELIEQFHRDSGRQAIQQAEHAREAAAWRSLFGSLLRMEYIQACASILNFLASRYGFDSLVWLARKDKSLEIIASRGKLKGKAVTIGLQADDPRLIEAAYLESPLQMRERRSDGKSFRTLNLFPVIVGGDLRSAVAVEGHIDDAERVRSISRFCQTLGPQLEILRLRHEVSERDWQAQAVRRFSESLKRIDADDFWTQVTQLSAELLRAERASLLIRSEKSDHLYAKAAIGAHANLFKETNIGDRVARLVLEGGSPVVVPDIGRIGLRSAPREWNYKSASFISYPIMLGDRRIAVLNFTDKADGDPFGDRDLELLQAIAPQLAVVIDRGTLKDKAGQFEQLSVTDPLTGLLNRRYLEERLAEEIQRSKRHRFPMSLVMLDVDEFKSYNDNFGHPAGDIALRIVADLLKETLRGADVAARYGGEEFAVL
ncbi:MAG TPA: diguanylate cyclase, partial [Pyrinomonadaceae bacterium]|nr:diguanylate cyclase [Pyrinomonadaceae bacterium]